MTTPKIIVLLLSVSWFHAGNASGQEPQPQEPAGAAESAEPTLAQPPQLKQLVPADIPPGTVFPAPEVEEILEIEVDASGKVQQVQVSHGAGEPFDGAALEAARKFEFVPARLSNGEPAPVTITFRMRIQQPPPVPPPPVVPTPAPAVKFTGVLLERGTRRPLAGVEVVVRAERELARVATDDEGRFSQEVSAAEFTLQAFPAAHEPLFAIVKASPGEDREERFYLEASGGGFETVVRVARVHREVSRQVIPKEVVNNVAGTQGDTLKVVQDLPGVARSSFGAGALVLRGASPEDSAVFLEGQEIPLLYHFGGLRSAFNSVFLEEVDFIPGNFGPDYGRKTGGVIDVRVRDPADDTFRGQIDLNFYDAGFSLEGPLGKGWSVGGAFHRSYIDSILPLVIPKDSAVSFDTAPFYYDYQLLATWKPDADTKLRILAYGSLDKVVVLFSHPQSDPTIRGTVDAQLMFHDLQISYHQRFLPSLVQDSTFLIGYQQIQTQIGPELFFNLDDLQISFRTSWEWQALDWLAARAGLDIHLDEVSIDLNSPFRPIEGENQPPVATQQVVASKSSTALYQPAFFLELAIKPLPGLSVLPSLRVDWYREIQRWTADPRLSVRYQVIDGTVLKGGIGFYQQPPTPDQSVPLLGNPNLMAERSSHSSLGVEQRLLEALDLDVTGFYKFLDRLVIRNPAFVTDPSQPPYLTGGSGRIYGLEVLLKVRLGDWFQGWLAYTFQRSFRTDGPGAQERLFDFDQPHILTVVGTVQIGAGWSAGLRFRLVSGNPATPVTGSIFDSNSGTYVPVYGEHNSERQDTFHQLDLRVDKLWTFKTWKLDLYLDVQNVYNQANQEGWTYSFDYSQRTPLTGLPILPILGIKGEW